MQQDMLKFDQKFVGSHKAWKYKSPPNDKHWKNMWYLHRNEGDKTAMDHNVLEAWRLGYTGKGVVVAIVDDGLEINHPDIKPNYDPLASYDYNDRDHDPTPNYIDKYGFYTTVNSHGTNCAGIVAAAFNNSLCVVGIAFNAKIGGIKILDGHYTDALEAEALSRRLDYVDIYSNSWGPEDDGKTLEGPLELARIAIKTGIKEVCI
uniref:Peptidase S8/S53 domain-containing protein n=1 Tax=Acrobeloides nanus TaxID=290746 RepID=A0A914DEA2_9BILA